MATSGAFWAEGALRPTNAGSATARCGSTRERTYFDVHGRKLGQLGQAPDNLLFNRAKFFREGNFRWTWSP